MARIELDVPIDFDEEFLMKQLINCLIVLHKGENPNDVILNAFTISQSGNEKTLSIRI